VKITDIRLTKLAIPHRELLKMGMDQGSFYLHSALIEATTDEGLTGFGEAPFFPEVTEHELDALKLDLLGEDPFNIERIAGLAPFEGPLYKTQAAVEIACWDIIGKSLKLPVYKLLGGKIWDRVEITHFAGIGPPENVAKGCAQAVERGIKTLKLKVGLDAKQDLEIVRAVREAVGEDIAIRIDANQAWSVGTAILQLKKLERYDPQYVEGPIARWDDDGLARIRARTKVPICICEGLTSLPQLMRLIKREAIDFISTDPVRMGGLLGFKKLCGIAEAEGIPVVLHACSLGVNAAAWLHAATSSWATMYAHDINYPTFDLGSWAAIDDIISEPFKHENGSLTVPEGHGLGVTISQEKLREWSAYYDKIESQPPRLRKIERFRKRNVDTHFFMPPRY
jgi:L-alanine-DL-glutamate epimerase-like enolase superfamily enzyme